jgi:hypothetical protein
MINSIISKYLSIQRLKKQFQNKNASFGECILIPASIITAVKLYTRIRDVLGSNLKSGNPQILRKYIINNFKIMLFSQREEECLLVSPKQTRF